MKKAVCSAIAGFLAAALFAAFGTAAGWAILYPGGTFTLMGILLLLFPIGLVVVLLLGIPTLLALSRFAPGRWWMPILAGLILGLVGLLVLLGDPTEAHTSRIMLVFVPLNALTALVFWPVWRWVAEQESSCRACQLLR